MVSAQRLLTYGSPVIAAIAILVVQYPLLWSALEESLDKFGEYLVAELLADKNIFFLSAAYARWALPCPGTAQESLRLKLVASCCVGLVARWNIEAARAGTATSFASGPCGFILCQFWPLFVVHLNSYLGVAAWDFFALAAVVGAQAVAILMYWTTWWYPLGELVVEAADVLLPVSEVMSAFHILRDVIGKEHFDQYAAELVIVVSYVQISLGYVNIWYMRQDKARSNALLEVASGKLTARQFLLEKVVVYVTSVALPYMLQRSVMETANSAFFRHCFNQVEESLRVDAFLHTGEHFHNRLEVVRDSNYTVDGYAESFSSLISTSYHFLEEKLYAVPNLVLMSGMLFSQPTLTLTLLPVSIGLDFGRVRAVTFVTTVVEETTKQLRRLADKRRKIEQHDVRHAEVISRTETAAIVAGRWETLASEILDITLWRRFLLSSKLYMNWIYYNNLLGVGIECAIARIMEIDKITAADIGVYAMVIEDAIGFLLTRYREAMVLCEFPQCISIKHIYIYSDGLQPKSNCNHLYSSNGLQLNSNGLCSLMIALPFLPFYILCRGSTTLQLLAPSHCSLCFFSGFLWVIFWKHGWYRHLGHTGHFVQASGKGSKDYARAGFLES